MKGTEFAASNVGPRRCAKPKVIASLWLEVWWADLDKQGRRKTVQPRRVQNVPFRKTNQALEIKHLTQLEGAPPGNIRVRPHRPGFCAVEPGNESFAAMAVGRRDGGCARIAVAPASVVVPADDRVLDQAALHIRRRHRLDAVKR